MENIAIAIVLTVLASFLAGAVTRSHRPPDRVAVVVLGLCIAFAWALCYWCGPEWLQRAVGWSNLHEGFTLLDVVAYIAFIVGGLLAIPSVAYLLGRLVHDWSRWVQRHV